MTSGVDRGSRSMPTSAQPDGVGIQAGPESFDAIVVGAGQAGPFLASRLVSAGLTVALVESGPFGGTCVNTGCTPTKTMVASAYAAHVVARAAEYGVRTAPDPRVDLATVRARAERISGEHRGSIEAMVAGLKGCTVLRHHARFVAAREMMVGGRRIAAPRIFLNVGGRPLIPDLPGLDRISFLTNVEMLKLGEVPRHLIVVGGSYIGLEFAQMFRRFGSDVTIIERGPRLLSREDREISAEIKDILEAEGIDVRLDADCIGFAPLADVVEVRVQCATGTPSAAGSHVLIAVGRRPNTDDMGLEAAGIDVDARGFIAVDSQLRTSAEGVWALGDCNGRGAFTHTAYNDFEIVAANLLDGESRSVCDRIPVYGLFIDPPLGRVGMTAAEARERGFQVRVGSRPMTRVARAVEKGEPKGSMRVVVDALSDQILGAAILGPGGDEAVHAVLSMMQAKGEAKTLARTMAIHPTVSELIPTILQDLSSPA